MALMISTVASSREPNQSELDPSYSVPEYDLVIPSPTDPVSSGELAAFVAAYEAGTVQGAADSLLLTQSAVTKRIRSLERSLGARVFDRGRFGVRPTSLGRTVYPPAKEALAQLQTVALAAASSRAETGKELRLGASLTIGEFLLPAWLSAFRVEEPTIHPQLEVINSTAVLQAVEDGRAQIGFVEGFVEGESAPTALESLVVARDELKVVVGAAHPWARRRSLTVSSLRREPYLTRERDSGTRAVATAALAARGITLTPALEVASTQSLKRMITSGGFGIFSGLAIADEERAGTLVGLQLRGVALDRELRAIRQRRRPAGWLAADRFWQWLERHTLHVRS